MVGTVFGDLERSFAGPLVDVPESPRVEIAASWVVKEGKPPGAGRGRRGRGCVDLDLRLVLSL